MASGTEKVTVLETPLGKALELEKMWWVERKVPLLDMGLVTWLANQWDKESVTQLAFA
jgi:hypothetical protein